MKFLTSILVALFLLGVVTFPNKARAVDTVAPHAPTNLAAVAGDGQVTLSWTNPLDSDFRYMRIYRSTTSGAIGDYFATNIIGTTYVDNTAVNGTTYYYNVRSVDGAANINTNTIQVSATPAAAAEVPVITNTSAEKSTVEVSPKAILADGVQASIITVIIKDSDGNPLPNKSVTVYSSRGINDIIPISTKQTGADGMATFEIKTSHIGYATITAMNGDIQLVQAPVVTIFSTLFTTPSPSPSSSPTPTPQAGNDQKPANVNDGDLIRAVGDYKVYAVKGDYRRWIQSAEIFEFYKHFSFSVVKEITVQQLESYKESWLVRADGDSKVYEINGDGTKHWLNISAEKFSESGRAWGMVYAVNNRERDFYKTGAEIIQ